MTIQEILSDLNVEFVESGHHHSRPGWIQLRNCPFCHSDNFHLGFNTAAHFFACWKCGGHNAWKVLTALGVGRDRVKDLLASVDTESPIKRERSRISLVEPPDRGPLLRAHREYLLGRGFDPARIAEVWGVEGIGISTRLSWRLYLPIVQRGTRVSWTTRAIGHRVEQRYISASAEQESVNHKHVIYGGDFCSHSIVVVEGPTDAWRVGPGAGALFGTAFSVAQVRKIVKFPRRIVCFDNTPDAQRRADELASQLACFPGTTENVNLDADDPGSASSKEIRLLRKIAKL